MQQPAQPTAIFIRHGQSSANVLDAKAKDSISSRIDESVIDCDITELGVEQSLNASEKLKDQNVTVVYMSPLRRAIQTALKVFENHPNKPKIICLPILREGIYSSSDIPGDITKTISDPSFKDVDFSLFENYHDKMLYWLEDFYDPDVKEYLLQLINDEGLKDKPEKLILRIWELVRDTVKNGEEGKNGLETNEALFERAQKVKEILKEKAASLPNGEKVAVVSHFLLLKSITAKGLENGVCVGHKRFSNCEVAELSL